MDKDVCKCGKSSAEYSIIGIDEFRAIIINSSITKTKYTKKVTCNSCGDQFSEFDPFMVKLIDLRYY
jgi:hypothetical protein